MLYMELGTALLFDLPAAARVEVDEAAPAVPAVASVSASDQLLAGIRDDQGAIARAEVAKLAKIVEWARLHTVDPEEGVHSTLTERGLDTELPVAGPGAPLLSDFAVMELSVVLGRSKDSGRSYIGKVVELAFRLPRTYGRVLAGEVAVWRALQIADDTRLLPADAAAYVDAHLARFAHAVTWAQVERLVEEALVRFDPDAAEERRREANEARGVDLGIDHVGVTGIAYGTTALELPDALDLEAAIARRAKLLGQLGDEDSLSVRRAKALGEIAREDNALDLPVADPGTGKITRTVPARQVEMVVHLSEDGVVARCGNTRTPVLPAQVARWLDDRVASPGGKVTVRPVLDLAACAPTEAYEIPDRIRPQVALGNPTCTAPYCTKRAEACDLDHTIPHDQGGPTCRCNLAPRCRSHHRWKTGGQAKCRTLRPGVYHWTLPTEDYLVDPTGTYLLASRPRAGATADASWPVVAADTGRSCAPADTSRSGAPALRPDLPRRSPHPARR